MKKLILALVLVSGGVAADCKPFMKDMNTCQAAAELTAELVKVLPVQINQEMMISKAFAVDDELNAIVTLLYKKADFEKLLTDYNMTHEDIEYYYETFLKNQVCSGGFDDAFVRFIRAGGSMKYTYRTVDGLHVHSDSINKKMVNKCEVK